MSRLSRAVLVTVLALAGCCALAAPASATPPPTVAGVSPASGAVGTLLTLAGTRLDTVDRVVLAEGGTATIVTRTATTLVARLPVRQPGLVHVRLGRGASTFYAGRFTYLDPPDVGWGRPDAIDPQRGGITGLSCATPAACVAVSGDGTATTWNGMSWTAPQTVFAPAVPEQGFVAISCARGTMPMFCAALTTDSVLTYADGVWSAPRSILARGAGRLVSVSCVGAGFCLAVDLIGNAYRFDGNVWAIESISSDPHPSLGLTAVSCSSPEFCVVSGMYTAYEWNAQHWQETASFEVAGFEDNTISCPADGWCLAGGGVRQYQILHGYFWSDAVHLRVPDGGDDVTAVSCAAVGDCVLGLREGDVNTLQDGVLAGPAHPDRLGYRLDALDCPAATACLTSSSLDGLVARYDGSVWGGQRVVDPRGGDPSAVACAPTGSCMLVDAHGYATPFTRDGAQPPEQIDAQRPLSAVACPTATLCVAVDTTGRAVFWDGSSWTTPAATGLTGFTEKMSCPSSTFCVAANDRGYAATFDGRHWSPARQVVDGVILALSCPAAGQCLAVGQTNTGHAVLASYAAGAWRSAASPWLADSLSCSAPGVCVAMYGDDAYYLSGGVWSVAQPLIADPTQSYYFSAVSCVTRDFCAAIASSAGDAYPVDLAGTSVYANSSSSVQIRGVACWAPGYCVATDPQGVRRT